MANIEKHPKTPVEQVDQADFSAVPTCARASHLIGQYIKGHHNGSRRNVPGIEQRTQPILMRLEDLPATTRNLERIRERVRRLNRLLADSGALFRLRVV